MHELKSEKQYRLLYIVVNSGQGSKVLHLARKSGISGGTVMLGRGTVPSRLLSAMALGDVRREIVLTAAEQTTADAFLQKLSRELKLEKPHHGIAFAIPIAGVCGSRGCKFSMREHTGGEEVMYHAIFVIVDKGRGEAAIDAAVKAGSKGGTVINARGSGIHETSRLFFMDVEPEKEIVLILSPKDGTGAVVSAIRQGLRLDEPGNGILFVQDVGSVYGLYE